MMQITLPHLLTSDRERIAEIHALRAKVGHSTMTDEELIAYCAWLGLRSELETMRIVAERFERGDVPA